MLSFFPMVPIVMAVLLYVFPFEKAARAVAVVTQIALLCASYYLFILCKDGEIITSVGNFDGFMGIILRADTLSSVLLMLASFIFLVAALYSFNDKTGRLFWFFLFIWQGVVSGIFLSDDIFNVFVLLEIVAVVISVMIMYYRGNRSMYDGMVYLMVNTVAMQFYLFGAGYIYKLTGTLDFNAAAQIMNSIDKRQLYLPYSLIMTAVCLKCALMPLFNWLPKAHGTLSAPSAVSALLSGLHIKTGIYLFIRFQTLFYEIAIDEFFLIIAIITGIGGFLFALSQTDIKLILAYSTISQVGMIIVGLSLGDSYSHTGSVYHIINHALFKTALFLCAGMIHTAYGTRNLAKIRGVMKKMPVVGAATLLAVLGIVGAPFFNGSVSKYFIMSGAGRAVSNALIFINLGTTITFIKYSAMLFGKPEPTAENIKTDYAKQAAVLIPAVLCFIGGIFGEQMIHFLFNINVSVDAAGYFEKIIIFTVSVAAGFAIYKYFVSVSPVFKKIRVLDMSFRTVCVSMGGFFAASLLVLYFFSK